MQGVSPQIIDLVAIITPSYNKAYWQDGLSKVLARMLLIVCIRYLIDFISKEKEGCWSNRCQLLEKPSKPPFRPLPNK